MSILRSFASALITAVKSAQLTSGDIGDFAPLAKPALTRQGGSYFIMAEESRIFIGELVFIIDLDTVIRP